MGIGIATLVTQREQFHSNRLGESVSFVLGDAGNESIK
jgi:hypothetical protein